MGQQRGTGNRRLHTCSASLCLLDLLPSFAVSCWPAIAISPSSPCSVHHPSSLLPPAGGIPGGGSWHNGLKRNGEGDWKRPIDVDGPMKVPPGAAEFGLARLLGGPLGKCGSPSCLNSGLADLNNECLNLNKGPLNLNNCPKRLNGCHKRLNGCPKRLKGCLKRFNGCPKRLNGCPKRLNGCPKRFNGCPKRLNGCSKRFNGCSKRFNGCLKRFNGCLKRSNGCLSRLNERSKRSNGNPSRKDECGSPSNESAVEGKDTGVPCGCRLESLQHHGCDQKAVVAHNPELADQARLDLSDEAAKCREHLPNSGTSRIPPC